MSLSKTLHRIIHFFEENDILYVIIGAYALAYFGRIRATVDFDVAIAIDIDLDQFRQLLKQNSFTAVLNNMANPCFIIVDELTMMEIEVWRELDGVNMMEVLDRRLRITTPQSQKLWIIDPENYIINKLARPDRRAVDESDVASVLKEQADTLDYHYLYSRAEQARVLELLKTIEQKI